MTECLQQIFGPTPCFRDTGASFSDELPCGMNFCPVAEYLLEHPNVDKWDALHHQCVATDAFDYKGKYRSLQLQMIINNKR